MNPILFKDFDPTDLLNEKFGKPVLATLQQDSPEKQEQRPTWKTSYGASFQELSLKKMDLWGFHYDKDLLMRPEQPFGVFSGADVDQAIKVLEKDPNKLKDMPKGMKILQEKGAKVRRHPSHFGQWQAYNEQFSVINNPLGVSLGYTFNEDDYEIMTFSNNKVYEHLTLNDVLSKVKHLLN